MSIVIRIDVDRPYGRAPIARHILSRLSSDLYFPRIGQFGYLAELLTILSWLNENKARAHVFFRRCTLPSKAVLDRLDAGGHAIGVHLENSRSFDTFVSELKFLERCVGQTISAVSKHGSGGAKYGLRHYAPYEPEKYVEWAHRASMRLFLGNLEDPSFESMVIDDRLRVFPSAFWLEPHWRDTCKFTVDWLLDQARKRDVVLLIHPENILADPGLISDFKRLIRGLESRIFS